MQGALPILVNVMTTFTPGGRCYQDAESLSLLASLIAGDNEMVEPAIAAGPALYHLLLAEELTFVNRHLSHHKPASFFWTLVCMLVRVPPLYWSSLNLGSL